MDYENPQPENFCLDSVFKTMNAIYQIYETGGDKEIAKALVTGAPSAIYYSVHFPEDREMMREQFVKTKEDGYLWVISFPEDRQHFVDIGLFSM